MQECNSNINQYNTNGNPHGLWEWYIGKGRLCSKGYYHNGINHGYWEIYDINGNLSSKGHYVNGEQQGCWKYYHNDKTWSKVYYGRM